MVLLLLHGGLYCAMTAILVGFFGAVLIPISKGMGRLIDEGNFLRSENAGLVERLSRERPKPSRRATAAEASALAKSPSSQHLPRRTAHAD